MRRISRALIPFWMGLAVTGLVNRLAMAAPGGNLSAVVELAVEQNPALHAAQAQTREAQAAWREARAQQWPMLSARSAFTRSDNPVYVFGSLLEQGQFGPQDFAIDSLNRPGYLNNVQSALDLGVPLFTAFQTQTQKQMTRLAFQGAQSQTEGLAQETRFQAVDAYLQVLLNQDMLQALQERTASAAREIADADQLRRKGLVLGSDYYAAQAILSGLKAWQVRLQSDFDTAQSRLAILTRTHSGTIVPQGTLSETAFALPPEEKWQLDALSARQDLQAISLQEQAAQAARRQADWSLLPSVEAFGSLETNTRDFDSNPTDRLIGVRATLPIGDPSYGPRTDAARAREMGGREDIEAVRQKIELEVSAAWKSVHGTLDSLPIAKESFDQAAKSLELFRPLYHEGRQSVLEVLRAEEGLARAQTGYLQTLYGLHFGYARLALAGGRLDADCVREIERHLNLPLPNAGEGRGEVGIHE